MRNDADRSLGELALGLGSNMDLDAFYDEPTKKDGYAYGVQGCLSSSVENGRRPTVVQQRPATVGVSPTDPLRLIGGVQY